MVERLTASTSPSPKALPPLAVTALSLVARMTAVSMAVTVRLMAVTVALATWASTLLRTSFSAIRPPTAVASESLML